MSNILTFRPRNAMLALLVLWLIASAFYYVQQLFAPSFYVGFDEGMLHKAVKYIVCILLGIYFCIAARAYGLLLFSVLLLLLAGFFAIDQGTLEIATVSILVVGTMIPFILVPSLWEDRMLLIGRVIVLCGAGVGIFSIIEMTFLASLFASTWASTGSIRSISTLFNPNNLGLYVGVALVLLPYMRLKALLTALCGALLIFSLVVSGSRTAWVSLVVVMFYALFFNADARRRIFGVFDRHLILLLFTGVALVITYTIYLTFSTLPEIEVTNRGVDLYTASVRLSNFFSFLDLIDGSLLFPDTQGFRADFIQDNFYLVVLNSFGVLGLLVFLAFFAAHFSFRRKPTPEWFPWKLVFLFYMVSGLSGSQLNSFPNNQLFFLSMGAVWIYRPAFRNSASSPPSFSKNLV